MAINCLITGCAEFMLTFEMTVVNGGIERIK